MGTQRSDASSVGRSIRLMDIDCNKDKLFVPPDRPFVVDKAAEQAFLSEQYHPTVERQRHRGPMSTGGELDETNKRLGVRHSGRRMAQVMLLLTVTAVPFWAFITATDGFFGKYSVYISKDGASQNDTEVPYMQPYALGDSSTLPKKLAALSFAGILEDKGERDLVSKMHYPGTAYDVMMNLPRDWFLVVVALMDVMAILLIIFMRRRFRASIKQYTDTYDKKVTEISDYTALVTGLPPKQTVEQVEKGLHSFFTQRYSKHVQLLVEQSGGNGAEIDEEYAVVQEVVPITTMGDVIELLKRKRQHDKTVERLMAQQVNCPKQDLTKKIAAAHAKYVKTEDLAQAAIQTQNQLHGGHVRGAFVVFQRTQFADDAIQSAPKGLLQRWAVKAPSKYCGTHALSVTKPAAPNNYIYENLATSDFARRVRVGLSNLVVAAILIAALAAVCGMKAYQQDGVTQLNVDQGLLSSLLARTGAIERFNTTAQGVPDYAGYCPDLLDTCMKSKLNPYQKGVNVTFAYGSYLTVTPGALQAYYSNTYLDRLSSCASRGQCITEPEDLQVSCLACYCQGLSAAAADGTLEYSYYQATVAKQRCASLTPFDRLGTSLSVGVAVVVALINTALSVTIEQLTLFERQRSHSARARSQCAKMAVAQYLNTSISPLIASAEIKWLAVVFGGVVFKQGYPDFTTNWYATAGVDATFLLVSAALVPRVTGWVFGYLQPVVMRWTTRAHTQEQHHELLLNGEFPLGFAVAEISLLTLHTLTFGAGVPSMYPLCALALALITVDTKVKLARMWPLPRRHDMACTQLYMTIVKAAVFIHLVFATWMLSYYRNFGQITDVNFADMADDAVNGDGGNSDGRSSETFAEWFQWRRIFAVTTWGHLALVAIFISLELLPRVWKVLRKFARLFVDRQRAIGDLPPAETPLTFEDAMNWGKFKGNNKSYSVFEVEKRLLMGDAETSAIKQRTSQSGAARKRSKKALAAGAASGELSAQIGASPGERANASDDSQSLTMPPAAVMLSGGRQAEARWRTTGRSSGAPSNDGSDVDVVGRKDTMTFQLAPPRRSGGGGTHHVADANERYPAIGYDAGGSGQDWHAGAMAGGRMHEAAPAVGDGRARRILNLDAQLSVAAEVSAVEADPGPLEATRTL